jgi:hypothetical protein
MSDSLVPTEVLKPIPGLRHSMYHLKAPPNRDNGSIYRTRRFLSDLDWLRGPQFIDGSTAPNRTLPHGVRTSHQDWLQEAYNPPQECGIHLLALYQHAICSGVQ